MTAEQKKISAKLNSVDGKLLLAKYCFITRKESKKLLKEGNEKLKQIDLLILRLIERGISKAELQVLMWIYDRLGWTEEEQTKDQKINISYSVLEKKALGDE